MSTPLASPPHANLHQELASLQTALCTPWPTLLTIVAAAWAAWHTTFHHGPTAALTLLGAQLALLAVIDLRTLTLPHLLTSLLALTGSIFAPLLLHITLLSSTIGGLLAFGGAFGLMALTDKLTGRASLGGGDVWLITAIGFWLGAGGLPLFVLASALTGIVSVIFSHLRSRTRQPFPFGPALAAAGWLAMLYQPLYWHTVHQIAAGFPGA